MLTIEQQLLLAKKAYDGIIAQGCPAVNDGVCVYRTDDGLKCGIGHLIADEVYHSSIEGKGANHIDVMLAVEMSQKILLDKVKPLIVDGGIVSTSDDPKDAKFLLALQQTHDHAAENMNIDGVLFLASFRDKFNKLENCIKSGALT